MENGEWKMENREIGRCCDRKPVIVCKTFQCLVGTEYVKMGKIGNRK